MFIKRRGPVAVLICGLYRDGNECPYGPFVCGRRACVGTIRYPRGGGYAVRREDR